MAKLSANTLGRCHSTETEIPTPDNDLGRSMADTVFIAKPLTQSISQESGQELGETNKQDIKNKWNELEAIAATVKNNTNRTASKETIEETIMKLCTHGFISLANLAELLGREPNRLRRTYLNPMVANFL